MEAHSGKRGFALRTGSRQAGDFLKMPQVAGQHGVTLLDRGGNHQIVERQHVSFRCLLPLDLADKPPGFSGDVMNRDQVRQFLDEQAARVRSCRSLSAEDSMHLLGHRDRREREIDRTYSFPKQLLMNDPL